MEQTAQKQAAGILDCVSFSQRTRLTADARRAQLVELATTLIARVGYNRFSILALAEEAGMTRAGVLHHVVSKEQLLVDILSARDKKDSDALTAALERKPDADVHDILDNVVRRNIAEPEFTRLFTVLSAEALDPSHPAHGWFSERLRRSVATLAPLLEAEGHRGEQTAVEILSYMDGLQLTWLRDPSLDMWALWRAFSERVLVRAEMRDE
jgi:AcrR family transcriptional regulator